MSYIAVNLEMYEIQDMKSAALCCSLQGSGYRDITVITRTNGCLLLCSDPGDHPGTGGGSGNNVNTAMIPPEPSDNLMML